MHTVLLIMALSFAHGSLAWNAADVATTVYTVSGLAFQPKAIIVQINGQSSATDAITNTTDARVCVGVGTGTADRRCQGFYEDDAAATMDTAEIYRDDAILATVSAAGAADGLLDLNSITSDGFTLIVDDAAPADLRVFWWAFGGADITNQQTGEITEPGATGVVSYTVGAGWQPDVVVFAGCPLTAAPPTAAEISSGLMIGAASGTAAGSQWVFWGTSENAVAQSNTNRYGKSGECVALMPVTGGNPDATAVLNAFDAAGFDLNWTARASTRKLIYLALQGGSWAAGNSTIDMTTIGNTSVISGLAFAPVGVLIASHGQVENTAATGAAGHLWSLGGFSSTTSRRTQHFNSIDDQIDAVVVMGISYDEVLVFLISTGTEAEIDVSAMASDGFTLTVDDAIARTAFYGYLAFGDEPAGAAAFRPLKRRQLLGVGH